MKLSEKLAKQLAEKRERAKALLAKGAEASDDEVKEIDSLIGEIENESKSYEAAVKREDFESANDEEINRFKNQPANPLPQPASGQAQFIGFGAKEAGKTHITDEGIEEEGFILDEKTKAAISQKSYKDGFMKYLRKGIHGLSSNELKDMESGVDSDGGYLVPVQFMAKLIERKPTPTRLYGRVQRISTSSDKMEMPRSTYSEDDIYTTGIRVTWTGEKPTANQHRTNTPDLGNITIPIHTAMLSCGVTNNQLEDAVFNLQSWLSGKFRETIDLLYDNMILNGSSIGQPAGILLNPGGENQPGIVKTGDANLVTADGIIDLAYAVPEQYDENCTYVFNKTNTGKAIAKMKDADDRYLFNAGAGRDGVASARPTDLVGYPFIYSGFMPNIAANSFPMIFGDLRGYYLAERIGFSLQVLNEIEALQNKKVLVGRVRFGGQVAEDWRLKVQKVAA